MRVAYFTETFLPKIDGIVTRITRSLDQLKDLGHEAIIFAPLFDSEDCEDEYRGFKVVRIPSVPFKPWYPELRLGLPHPAFYSELKEFQPDVTHAVNPFVLGAWGTIAARQMGIPFVASYHTDMQQYAERLNLPFLIPPGRVHVRSMHNTAQVNLTTSVPMMDVLRNFRVKRIRLWPKAVDTETFHPGNRSEAMRERLSGGHPEKPLIVCIGRLSHEKRVGWLAEAMKRLEGVRLAIVGSGPAAEELKQLFAGTDTVFTGYMSGQDLAEAYASADIFAFPSDTETLGFVGMESMASGVPVVGARAGGIPDFIRHGENSLMFDPMDMDDFVAQIRKLIGDPALRERFSRVGRGDMEACNWKAATEKLVDYYETAMRIHRRWKPSEVV